MTPEEMLAALGAITGMEWYGDADFAASVEDRWQLTACDDGSWEVVRGDYRQADGLILDAPSLDAAIAIVTLLQAADAIASGAEVAVADDDGPPYGFEVRPASLDGFTRSGVDFVGIVADDNWINEAEMRALAIDLLRAAAESEQSS